MTSKAAQKKIAERMVGKAGPDPADWREFVRMIDTQEATVADFVAVGGFNFAVAVARAWWFDMAGAGAPTAIESETVVIVEVD